jgi:chemotaxis methyl-accepting protein methylase
MLVKYFTQVKEQWRLADKIRSMVQFRQINLLSDFAPQRTHLFRPDDEGRGDRPAARHHGE